MEVIMVEVGFDVVEVGELGCFEGECLFGLLLLLSGNLLE